MMEIIATSWSEAKRLGLSKYRTGKPCPAGHIDFRALSGDCFECRRIKYAEAADKNRERSRNYYKANADQRKETIKQWQKNNPEKRAKHSSDYCKRNAPKRRAQSAKRRARQGKATLPGYDAELRKIYEDCPEGWHVDHDVPLFGRNVCGLHVPWNLQYLTPLANRRKGCRHN